MLLAEKKVWDIVSGKSLPLTKPSPPVDDQGMTVAGQRKAESNYWKQINDWNAENTWYEWNDEALCIITFTFIDSLLTLICYTDGNTKAAWLELENVYASKDKQQKYSLLKCLYWLKIKTSTTLSENEWIFDELV